MGQLTYLKQLQMYPFPHHLSFKKVVQGYLFILISDIHLLFILFLLLYLLLLFLLLLFLLILRQTFVPIEAPTRSLKKLRPSLTKGFKNAYASMYPVCSVLTGPTFVKSDGKIKAQQYMHSELYM